MDTSNAIKRYNKIEIALALTKVLHQVVCAASVFMH